MNKPQSVTTSQSFECLDDWLAYFDTLHGKTIDLGLERIGLVAESLELKQLPGKVILLAGTNGKGTTSRFLEACLLAQGYTTGVFNSPHIVRYNECVRINGRELGDDIHMSAFAEIEQGRGEISLTPFEFSTLSAFHIFKHSKVDYVIVEVGMGGRGDSTNIIEPDISVITTVDIDHQAFLGNDIETIGFEKAGVMRPDKPVVIGEYNVPQSVLAYAEQIAAKPYVVNRDFHLVERMDAIDWACADRQLNDLATPNIPAQNVATAMMVLHLLGVLPDNQSINQVLLSLVVEGRFETISQTPYIIIDVAHNVESAGFLAGQLQKLKDQGIKRISAVAGMLKDKDIEGTLGKVCHLIDDWHLADLPGVRGAAAEQLSAALEKLSDRPYSCYDSVEKALRQARQQWQSDQLIIVFGSFVTIAQVLQGEKS